MLTLIGRSWRSWQREKGLAILAVIALAIGIGSATAIFTVVDTVLLKPLPYNESDRWVELLAGSTRDPKHFSGLSFAELLVYREQLRNYQVFGWFPVGGDYNLTSPGQPRHVEGIEVSPTLMPYTGALPVVGRFFSESDGPNTVVISHRLFESLGPAIVGRPINLNGKPYTVVGVMPAWFRLPLSTVYDQDSRNDVWLPLQQPPDEEHLRNYAFYSAYGKLKPGVTMAQATAEAKRVAAEIRRQFHPTDPTYTSALFSLQDSVVNTIRPILLLLFAAAGLLLLITCANVAGLLVSRSVGRARETAIRVALGASQKQLALQYLFESLWVSLAAAVCGILASIFFVRTLVSLAADYIPRADEVSINWQVALFAVLLAFLTATLAALAPLWQALRIHPNEVLSDGVRASAGIRSRKLSQGLVIGEIALAFTLISLAALLVWEFRSLVQTSPGFDPQGVYTFRLTRAGAENAKPAQSTTYANALVEALEAIPGVTNAAVANQIPLAGCCFTTSLFPDGGSPATALHQGVSLMVVSPGYFKTLAIPLLAGRVLNLHDTSEDPLAILIDQAAAKRYWPNRNAVGQRAHLGGEDGSRAQVVGIVGTVLNDGLAKETVPEIYISPNGYLLQSMNFVVRSTLTPASLNSAIRRAVAHVDPSQPIYDVQSMDKIVNDSLVFQRLEWIVVTFFALAALLLAGLGIYGLTSYSVRQRTTEMGTRMALGSSGGQLLRLIVASGIRLSFYGILIGAAAVSAATVLVTHYFEVRHLSPVPYLLSLFAVLLLALFASLLPAWRASLLSPMVAIRNENDSVWVSARRTLTQARERIAADKPPAIVDSTLLTEFIEASRNAASFSELLSVSLGDLLCKVHAKSALLLEKVSPTEFRIMAASPMAAGPASFSIPENGFLLNRLRFYGSPLGFSAADLETSHRWATVEKPRHVAELELLQTAGLRLAAPLRTKHDLIGLLLFGERQDDTAYSPSEKRLIAVCAEQFALTMENARLNERLLEQEKVRRDLALATEVQKRLLPEGSPQTAATSLGAYTLAARNIGGDYYDFLKIGDHTLGIALADVAGKGIAAALIMAVVQASLRIIAAEENVSLPQLAAKMNKFLHGATGFNSYATFFYANLDESKRQLRYVNAGHNPPYLVRAQQSDAPIEELSTGGMVIGMFPLASYEEAVVDLQKGDLLIAFTDGVTEALSPAEEEFGEDRLKELIRRVAHLPILEITAQVSQSLRDWIGSAPQHDDLTFVVMKVNE